MPRMCSPQELLRDSRRELLSRSSRSSSPLERSEPIALMERGRTCGLFFRHPHAAALAATALAATIPYGNSPLRGNHSLRQPPPPRRHPHAAVHHAAARTLPSTAPRAAALATPAAPPHEARIHPSRCGCFTASPGKNRTVCVLFSTNACNKPSPWQYLPEMYAFRDRNGKILALCVHFQVQSGGFGYMA